MSFESQQSGAGPFPIVIMTKPYTSNTLPLGTIAYHQSGVFGTPLGLLLALTTTPNFSKVIQSTNGLWKVS